VRVIVLLIAAGGAIAAGFLAAFVWAVRSGQYDDPHTPAIRILFDDTPVADTLPPPSEGLTDVHVRS
jgi:cbb3-type cytochrome oxidase maturation protein